ncbi:MAG: GNAT family N-acetyltransferase [Armatimonadetes bacterium]|nr:GNAT family N-acetyltransferase [Armatimonadota bacterium]
MEKLLDTVKLKSGEDAEIWLVRAPAPDWAERILPLLAHKGEPWLGAMRRALHSGLGELNMSFFECVVRNELCGNITVVDTLQRPIGILQHVFTRPEHRQKGIAVVLMAAACEDFRARDGRALYLATGNPVAATLYERFGFHALGHDGAMLWPLDEGFEQDYFRPQPCEVRPVCWADWPLLTALYSATDGWVLRNLFFGHYGPSFWEGPFLSLMAAQEQGTVADNKVLCTKDGAIVGHAMLWIQKAYREHPLMVDFFVHPAFLEQAEVLLAALAWPDDRKVQAAMDNDAAGRHEALARAGFWREATLRNQFSYGGRWCDVSFYCRPWVPPTGR